MCNEYLAVPFAELTRGRSHMGHLHFVCWDCSPIFYVGGQENF